MLLKWPLLFVIVLTSLCVRAETPLEEFELACRQLKASANNAAAQIREGNISRTTYYITPLFTQWTSRERQACQLQGACITDLPGQEPLIYDYRLRSQRLDEASCPFGYGNRSNCKHPCNTVAADQSIYPFGSLIYIPSLDGVQCPQSGESMNGCFYVGDSGGDIRGRGRFDLYLGECEDYNAAYSSCENNFNGLFELRSGTPFFWVRPTHPFAQMSQDYIESAP